MQRRVAVRDALLHWLYDQPKGTRDVTGFLSDWRSWFYGQQVTEPEVVEAQDSLYECGLITGKPNSSPVLILPRLTKDGEACVERFGSSVGAWQDRGTAGTAINITGSHGVNVAANSPGADQSITLTTDVRRQLLLVADAFEQTLPCLGLSAADEDEARAEVEELRQEVAHESADQNQLAKLLHRVKSLAGKGTGVAASAGITLLV